MNRTTVCFLTIIHIFLSQAAFGQDYPEEKCDFYHAEYKPHIKSENEDFDYSITTAENKNKGPSEPRFYMILHTYKKANNELLNSFKMPFICVGMSVRRCYLQASAHHSDKVLLSMLSRDFSQSPISKKTPYALVIPQSAAIFHSIHWDKVETIQHFTDNKVNPDFRVPDVWVFDECSL